MKIRNVSGRDREVPILHRVVEADAVVDVPARLAPGFLCQPETWESVEPDPDPIDNETKE